MTKRSKNASADVVGNDGKTVDQTIISSIEIRSRSVETSSENAGAMVVASSSALLGLELMGVENKGENVATSTHIDMSPPNITAPHPLLGTRYFQHTVIVDKSSSRRSRNSVCYGNLLRDFSPIDPSSSTETGENDDLNCYGKPSIA